MGKGDQKSKRGKVAAGSFGKVRPRAKSTASALAKKAAVKVAIAKAAK